VPEKGKYFVVQFPLVEKLAMLMNFDEFKLKGTQVYIKVVIATKKVFPKGRFTLSMLELKEFLME
jgi:hypothetical protein